MMNVLLAPILLAIASVQPTPSVRCNIAHLTSCENTNVLLGSPRLAEAMKAFLGKHAHDKVGYLYANGRLIDQIWAVLGGPPDDRHDLSNGEFLFTACRQHSCDEKGAIAFDAEGRITALGIINFHCSGRPETCADGRRLDLFVRDDTPENDAGKDAIVEWASAINAVDATAGYRHPFKGVVVHRLSDTI